MNTDQAKVEEIVAKVSLNSAKGLTKVGLRKATLQLLKEARIDELQYLQEDYGHCNYTTKGVPPEDIQTVKDRIKQLKEGK